MKQLYQTKQQTHTTKQKTNKQTFTQSQDYICVKQLWVIFNLINFHTFLPYFGPGFVLVKIGIFFPWPVAPELNVQQFPYLQFHVRFQYFLKSLYHLNKIQARNASELGYKFSLLADAALALNSYIRTYTLFPLEFQVAKIG